MEGLPNTVEKSSDAGIDETVDLRKKFLELGTLLKEAPSNLNVWVQYLNAAVILDELDEGVETVLACIAKVPEPETDFLPIGQMLQQNGWISYASKIYTEILRCDCFARQTHSHLIGIKHLYGDNDDDAFEEFKRWNDRFVRPLIGLKPVAETCKNPTRRLRIGFVSLDFGGGHSLNRTMAPWFTHRNRTAHAYICYSGGPASEPIHPVFRENADEIVDVSRWSDAELNDRIRADGIDILVDITSHMVGNRLLAYAPKPAPIVVSWLGLGLATGIEVVDYFLADKFLVPPGVEDRYQEKVVLLPGSGLPWSPPSVASDIAPPPVLRNGFVSFGNFSRLVKFQPETIALWAEVLKAVPNSTFTFKHMKISGNIVSWLETHFESAGVAADRLIFRPWSDQATHLESYNEIDVMLDSFPEQGGVSGLEAVWMGVPIVAYMSSERQCHAGTRILNQVGLPDLVTTKKDQFVEIAKLFARRSDLLIGLRKSLRGRLSESMFCDGPRYMRGVDRAFAEMWRRYCADLPPTHFAVSEDEECPIRPVKSERSV